MARTPRLLVVDDEVYLGNSLRRLWRRRFQVVVAHSVDHALEELDGVDVVLCDLKMPDRGGAELYAEIRRRRPELLGRVVFMTGDLCCHHTAQFLGEIPNARYEKPFDTRRVADALERIAAA